MKRGQNLMCVPNIKSVSRLPFHKKVSHETSRELSHWKAETKKQSFEIMYCCVFKIQLSVDSCNYLYQAIIIFNFAQVCEYLGL